MPIDGLNCVVGVVSGFALAFFVDMVAVVAAVPINFIRRCVCGPDDRGRINID